MFPFLTVFRQSFPPASSFDVERDIPDLTGKAFAVTGGYTGVGFETCKALVAKNADVYIIGRTQSKADSAITRLKEASPEAKGKLEFVMCDLQDLDSVRKGAEDLKSKTSHLEGLFNNAGVMMPPRGSLSANRLDLQFATNNLAHHHLTLLLIDTLLATPFKEEGFPRVCTTSSIGHLLFAPPGGFDYDSVRADASGNMVRERRKEALYGQSKLGNIWFANELHRRYGSQGLISTSCNPGNLNSELYRHGGYPEKLKSMMLYDCSYGALSQLYAVTTPEAKELGGGKYFIPWAQVGETRPECRDVEAATKFWDFCEELRKGH